MPGANAWCLQLEPFPRIAVRVVDGRAPGTQTVALSLCLDFSRVRGAHLIARVAEGICDRGVRVRAAGAACCRVSKDNVALCRARGGAGVPRQTRAANKSNPSEMLLE